MKINNKEGWKDYILREARYELPEECKGGLCIDAGTNIGDFPMNFSTRFDKYIMMYSMRTLKKQLETQAFKRS